MSQFTLTHSNGCWQVLRRDPDKPPALIASDPMLELALLEAMKSAGPLQFSLLSEADLAPREFA